jgi:hypothetical protein
LLSVKCLNDIEAAEAGGAEEVLELAGRRDEASAAAREAGRLYAAKSARAGVRLAEARAAELEA